MAYTTPPTFNTGDILSAGNLNILSDDIEYLNGFVVGTSPAMVSVNIPVDGDVLFIIKHTQRYLKVKYRAQDRCRIWYNGTNVYDQSGTIGDQTVSIDTNSAGLTLNQFYTLKFSLESTADPLWVYYAYEAAS